MKSTRMDLHHPPGWTIELSRELTFSGSTKANKVSALREWF